MFSGALFQSIFAVILAETGRWFRRNENIFQQAAGGFSGSFEERQVCALIFKTNCCWPRLSLLLFMKSQVFCFSEWPSPCWKFWTSFWRTDASAAFVPKKGKCFFVVIWILGRASRTAWWSLVCVVIVVCIGLVVAWKTKTSSTPVNSVRVLQTASPVCCTAFTLTQHLLLMPYSHLLAASLFARYFFRL